MSYAKHPIEQPPAQCRFCDRLNKEGQKLGNKRAKYWYRCLVGRFDIDGAPTYYAWSGIIKPNKAVGTIQKDCPQFFYSYDISEQEVAHEVL
jgi:hypothetical protein